MRQGRATRPHVWGWVHCRVRRQTRLSAANGTSPASTLWNPRSGSEPQQRSHGQRRRTLTKPRTRCSPVTARSTPRMFDLHLRQWKHRTPSSLRAPGGFRCPRHPTIVTFRRCPNVVAPGNCWDVVSRTLLTVSARCRVRPRHWLASRKRALPCGPRSSRFLVTLRTTNCALRSLLRTVPCGSRSSTGPLSPSRCC